MRTIGILGGGNGGHAAAADLSLRGFEVSLFSRYLESLKPIHDQGGILLVDDQGERLVPIRRLCERVSEAVKGAALVLIIVPATAHEYYANACARHLHDGQIIVLNPGSTGGALGFKDLKRKRKESSCPCL